MREQNQMNSGLNVSFWCIFLFAFLMLPIGCNKKSDTEGTSSINSQESIEPQNMVETQEVNEPQETEAAAEPNTIEIAPVDPSEDWDIQLSIGHEVPIGPIDIKVYIDNKLAINKEFQYDGQRMTPFCFKLSKGEHELRIESEKGRASFKQVINVTGMVNRHMKSPAGNG